MGSGELHNMAYDLFIKEYGVKFSKVYSSFENVVKNVDILGKDLFIDSTSPYGGLLTVPCKDTLKSNIGLVISSLIALAEQQNVSIEDKLVEALEKCKK